MDQAAILNERVQRFQREGWLNLDPLTNQQVDEVLTWLRSRPVFVGRHVVQADTEFTTWDAAADANVLCWTLETAVLAPHLLERALAEFDFAAEYLGTPNPLLYSMNVFVTRPGQPVRPDIQDFHRDTDDVKFLPMFSYLTDVWSDACQQIRVDNEVLVIEGLRGTTFFSDTMREHRGLKPQRNERIIAWARWCVSDPPASYKWDKLAPADARLLGDRYLAQPPRIRNAMKLVAA
jgi:hypothetical protein